MQSLKSLGSLAAALFLRISSIAQVAPKSPSDPPFLARIERLWEHRDVCMLIGRDGSYRLERILPGKTEVFAGALSVSERDELERILRSDELQRLTQETIGEPIVAMALDELTLSIGRSGTVQSLTFPDAESRKPLSSAIDPILKWLDRAQELKGARLDDASASHCLPPPKRSASSHRLAASYLVQMNTDEIFVSRAERTCVVVYSTGQYRRERQKQAYRDSLDGVVYEGSLSADQIKELRAILDSPDLMKAHSQTNEEFSRFAEGTFTRFNIPREDTVQRLSATSYYKVAHDPREPGGMAGVHTTIVNDNKNTKALQAWLERNVMKTKLQPVAGTSPNGCAPRR